jgi:hypothetical protein
LTAVVNDSPSPAQRAAAEDRLRSFAASTERAFAGASFFPYGLDDQWRGLRRFGGHGGSPDQASSLTLAFGDDPSGEQSAEVRIETELPRRSYGDAILAARDLAFRLTRQQVEHLWHRTGVLRDDVRRAAFPVDGDRRHDPTMAWDRATIPVDGAPVVFRVLGSDERWVAQAIIDPLVVGISSYRWPITSVGLRSETAFEVYAAGTAELHRRRR